MANSKPKKTSNNKKSSNKTKAADSKKTEKVVVAEKKTVGNTNNNKKIFAGFFARKGDPNETITTIFKSHKIWGALIGELVGTMLLMMVLLTLGVQPLYMIFATIGVTIAVVGLSGANLNPLITAGMMATRRISAIRGVLYILAQIVGAWLGMIIINGFRLGSGAEMDLPQMDAITGDHFWAVTFIELLGAIVIGFVFARALKFRKKSPVTFGLMVTSGVTMAIIFGIVVAQSYFQMSNAFIYNPAAALMYQVLPSTADSFGQLMGDICLALTAYAIVPCIGGIAGFFLSDASARLADENAEE